MLTFFHVCLSTATMKGFNNILHTINLYYSWYLKLQWWLGPIDFETEKIVFRKQHIGKSDKEKSNAPVLFSSALSSTRTTSDKRTSLASIEPCTLQKDECRLTYLETLLLLDGGIGVGILGGNTGMGVPRLLLQFAERSMMMMMKSLQKKKQC